MTEDTEFPIHENRVWSDEHWTARVVKNEDDDGWAVAMFLDGEAEPALVGPWTMGRDKKNPKPLDTNAFNTLVKTAKEVIRRSEQQRHAELNKNVTVTVGGRRVRVHSHTLALTADKGVPMIDGLIAGRLMADASWRGDKANRPMPWPVCWRATRPTKHSLGCL